MNTRLRKRSDRLFGAAIVLPALLVCASLFASQPPTITRSLQPTSTSGSDLIKGYRQWNRVNPEPVVMSARVAANCAAPVGNMDSGNPHLEKFVTVYVNDIGRHAMMEEAQPHFPIGSIIVKEKLPSKDSTTPELLTVMIKRETGYDKLGGDWEYMALDGTGETVQARGQLEKCQACHLMVSNTDYVSRIYLPQDVREKLK